MTNSAVAEMIELKSEGKSYQAIGALFAVSRQRVHQIISGYKTPSKQNRKIQLTFEAILERDNYRCQDCGVMTDLVVHHRDGDDRNNRDSNLVCLCNPCHLTLHRPLIKSSQRNTVASLSPTGKDKLLAPKRAAELLGVTQRDLWFLVKGEKLRRIVRTVTRSSSRPYKVEFFSAHDIAGLKTKNMAKCVRSEIKRYEHANKNEKQGAV